MNTRGKDLAPAPTGHDSTSPQVVEVRMLHNRLVLGFGIWMAKSSPPFVRYGYAPLAGLPLLAGPTY